MTQKKSELSPALLALTAAAMNLPGLASVAHGATTINKPSLGYRFTQYSEDSLSTPVGSGERYTVETNQFRILLPINEFAQANIDLLSETMSGSSPIAVVPSEAVPGGVPGGDPVQIMSGATIEDQRTDGSASLLLTKGLNTITTRVGVSDENDYRSINGGVEWGRELSSRLTTLTSGLGFSSDDINPTDGGTEMIVDGARTGRPGSEEKQTVSGFFGVTRVLSNNSAVQSGLTLTHHTGFLSDPYKTVFVADRTTPVADNRPDSRNQVVWLTQYRQFFADRSSALNADYRFYIDDWGAVSHTVDLSWHQNFKSEWKIIPSLRYYTQSRSDFYQLFFDTVPADGELSSDYRLSPYGAISARVRAEKQLLERWTFNLSIERYASGSDLTLGSVGVEAPGLVDFFTFSLGVDAAF